MMIAEQLSVKIGEQHIIDDISAQLENGKVTAILGPNGAGKSTLLKCLTGSQKLSQGAITIDGKPLKDYSLNELSTKRAVLSQSSPINFPFTVLEIVMMGRNPYTSTNSEDYEIAMSALECVDATHLKDRIFPTLSGGEQQRVQLARVLTQLWEQENAYLFLDEPTSALDLKHQHHLLSLASEWAKEKHFAVCIIMHDLNLAMRYSDHILLLHQGKLFASGTPQHVLSDANISDVFDIPAEMVFGTHTQIIKAA